MKYIASLFIALTLALTGCSVASQEAPVAPTHSTQQTTQPTTQPTQSQCEEDQPCWDCHTMGNKQCGPATVEPTASVTTEAVPTETVTVAPLTASQPIPSELPTASAVVVPVPITAPATAQPVAPQPVAVAVAPQPVATPTAQPVATPQPVATSQPTTAQGQPHIDCANLKPGDAWAGVSIYCGHSKPVCPPIEHGPHGENIVPANAPKECIYAQ